MKAHKLLYILPVIVLIAFTSCKKDPEIPNEEELITTLIYTLTPQAGGVPVVMMFQDLDGDGGAEPEIMAGTLSAGVVYNGVIALFNESVNPTEDITEEVEEEGDEHQLFYIVSGTGTLVQYADTDSDGFPLGLATTLTAGEAATGTLTIILRHLPVKTATGVSNGDITFAGGETDIEVTFPLTIE